MTLKRRLCLAASTRSYRSILRGGREPLDLSTAEHVSDESSDDLDIGRRVRNRERDRLKKSEDDWSSTDMLNDL